MHKNLGVADALVTLPFFRLEERAVLAAVYRRAALVLQPSEAEGLGLPVIEALACGTLVLASDIPALREVGAGAAVYCPVGDIPAWTRAALNLLDDRLGQTPAYHARRAAGLARARLFQWPHHAGNSRHLPRGPRASRRNAGDSGRMTPGRVAPTAPGSFAGPTARQTLSHDERTIAATSPQLSRWAPVERNSQEVVVHWSLPSHHGTIATVTPYRLQSTRRIRSAKRVKGHDFEVVRMGPITTR